ncbi:ATP-binding cassette domain-containing protein [Desulfonema magnum]|uniref:ATP-binding cassette domain-containing protein n=1 Tax=Desulfonema magnum TaxID=45655 RepID=UPI001A9AA521|nr:ATP-binding cassette domain-containing protein [Desulfonema magnum]
MQKTLYILLMTVISGISAGAIVPLVVNVTEDMVSGKHDLCHAFLLPLTVFLFIFTKRLSQQHTVILTEKLLERTLLRLANTIRHYELAEIETQNRSDIFLTAADAQTVTDAAAKNADAFQHLVTIVVCWFYVFWLTYQGGAILILAFLLIIVVYELFQNLTDTLASEEADTETKLFDSFNHILDGFKEIKLSQRKNDDLYDNYLTPLVLKAKDIRARTMFYFSEYVLFIYICLFAVMSFDIFILSSFYSRDVIIKLLIITIYISRSAMVILSDTPYIINGRAAMKRLERIAEADHKTARKDEGFCPASGNAIQAFTKLTLEDIRFDYGGSDDTPGFSVGPVNLTIRAGDIVFITGGNGSGKSTLMKILTGLYSPTSGVFKIDEKPVSMADWRHLFSAIFTDFHLFDALYGLDAVDEEKIHELLEQMDLAHKTRCVGGRFTNRELSLGQRKRLALIVALSEDKPVYIFDEWAADQDPHFRQYFYESLLPSFKAQGKTVIAVTHDDRYFHAADQMIKMDYGKVRDVRSEK